MGGAQSLEQRMLPSAMIRCRSARHVRELVMVEAGPSSVERIHRPRRHRRATTFLSFKASKLSAAKIIGARPATRLGATR